MNPSLIPVPAFLSDETLCRIPEIASQVPLSQKDFVLSQNLTTVQGYAELIAEAPTSVAYHIALTDKPL